MIGSTEAKLKKLSEYLLFSIIILSRIPPITLESVGINLNSYNILGILLPIAVILLFPSYKKNSHNNNNISNIFVLFFFFCISASILTADNMSSFITTYKDIVLSLLLYYVTINVVSKKNINMFIMSLVISSAINITYQLITYYLPSVSAKYFEVFIYEKYLQFFNYQKERGRFFGDAFDEILIVLFCTMFTNSNGLRYKAINIIVLIGSVYVSIISNWRSKFVMMVISITILFVRLKSNKARLIVMLVPIAIIIFISYVGSLSNLNQEKELTIVSRLIFEDQQDIKTINSRFILWDKAVEITKSSPFFGVGLGNFFDHLTSRQKTNMSTSSITNNKFILIDDPHNILFSTLSTTGLLGFIGLVSLLGSFLYIDYSVYKFSNSKLALGLIIAFWLLIAYTLFNPWQYYSLLSLFWYLRGILFVLKYE